MTKSRIFLISFIAILIAAFFIFDLGQYFNIDYLKERRADINTYYAANPITTGLIFFSAYVVFTALSLPAAGLMTLAAGVIFGLLWGTILVSFASVIGATLAFLASRFLFRDMIQTRFADKLVAINAGIAKDGAFYLFTLRLVPIFPFFVINAVMGLTPIRTFTFAWVSQIGMLLPTMVFVNAGTQLAKISTLKDVLSPQLIASFALLGVFPLIAKKLVEFLKSRKPLQHDEI